MWLVQENSHVGGYIENYCFNRLSDAMLWLFRRLEDEKANPVSGAFWSWRRPSRSNSVCRAVLDDGNFYLVAYEVFDTSSLPVFPLCHAGRVPRDSVVFHRYS